MLESSHLHKVPAPAPSGLVRYFVPIPVSFADSPESIEAFIQCLQRMTQDGHGLLLPDGQLLLHPVHPSQVADWQTHPGGHLWEPSPHPLIPALREFFALEHLHDYGTESFSYRAYDCLILEQPKPALPDGEMIIAAVATHGLLAQCPTCFTGSIVATNRGRVFCERCGMLMALIRVRGNIYRDNQQLGTDVDIRKTGEPRTICDSEAGLLHPCASAGEYLSTSDDFDLVCQRLTSTPIIDLASIPSEWVWWTTTAY